MAVVQQLCHLYRRLADVGESLEPVRIAPGDRREAAASLEGIKREIGQFIDAHGAEMNDATRWNLRLAAAQVDDLLATMSSAPHLRA